MPTSAQNGSGNIYKLTPDELADAEFEAALERRRFRKEAEAASAKAVTALPQKERPPLDSPYDPAGMDILRAAEYGMSDQSPVPRMNKRASRMQQLIVDFQKVMNPDQDPDH